MAVKETVEGHTRQAAYTTIDQCIDTPAPMSARLQLLLHVFPTLTTIKLPSTSQAANIKSERKVSDAKEEVLEISLTFPSVSHNHFSPTNEPVFKNKYK
jgi:hypothetical protein